MTVIASTFGCIQAGSRWGDIIGTLGIGVVTCGIGDVGMGRTSADVCKNSAI